MNNGIKLWQIQRIRLGGGKYLTVEMLGVFDVADQLGYLESSDKSIQWSTALLIRLGLINRSFQLATSPEEADNWQAAEHKEMVKLAIVKMICGPERKRRAKCEAIKKESPEMFKRIGRGEISITAAQRELKAAREASLVAAIKAAIEARKSITT